MIHLGLFPLGIVGLILAALAGLGIGLFLPSLFSGTGVGRGGGFWTGGGFFPPGGGGWGGGDREEVSAVEEGTSAAVARRGTGKY